MNKSVWRTGREVTAHVKFGTSPYLPTLVFGKRVCFGGVVHS